ncbi:hypothetical protein ABSA28_00540 [Candidatus Hepatincolaceae symbiont of Richtersius coronifer]
MNENTEISFIENTNVPTVEEQVIVNSIKNFDSSNSDPTKKVFSNILDAFDFEVVNLNGGEVKIEMQRNTGSFIPTIIGDYHTDTNTLEPTLYKNKIEIYQLAHELKIDINKLEDGKVDLSLAVQQAQDDLETASMSLMIMGEVFDKHTGQGIKLLKNSFMGIGNTVKSDTNFGSSSANKIGSYVNERMSEIEDATGKSPDTLLISKKAWRKMGTAETTISEFIIWNYLTEVLGLNIFPTSYLDNVPGKGAAMALFRKDPAMLKGYIGKPPHVRKNKKTNNYIDYNAILMSIGGFENLTGKSGSIDISTHILG